MLVVEENAKKVTPPLEEGSYIARCVQVLDIGEQYNKMADKYQRNLMLTFELPTETVEVNGEDKPRILSKIYNYTLNEKGNLRKDLVSWIGKLVFPFDVTSLLGQVCMVGVSQRKTSTGKIRNEIKSIMKPMKGVPVPEQVTPSYIFDIDADNAVEECEKLPEWIRKMVQESPTWQGKQAEKDLSEFSNITSGELPF